MKKLQFSGGQLMHIYTMGFTQKICRIKVKYWRKKHKTKQMCLETRLNLPSSNNTNMI